MLDIGAKKRLIGAVVLVILAVIILPMLVEEGPDHAPAPESEFAMPAQPPVDRARQAEVFPTLEEARPWAMDEGTAPDLSEAQTGEAAGLSADELEAVAPETYSQPVAAAAPAKQESVKPAPAKPASAKPAPVKPALVKQESAKPEPAKAAPAKPEPAKTAPAKPEPAKPAPAKPEPAKPAPAKPEPAKTAPTKPEQAKPVPAKPEPPKQEPRNTPIKPDPVKTAPPKPEPKADPVKAKAPEAAPKPVPKGLGSWVVQVAALATPEAAQRLEQDLRGKGYSAFVQKLEGSNRTLWRVRVGPEIDHDRAKSMADDIKRHTGIPDVNVRKYRDG